MNLVPSSCYLYFRLRLFFDPRKSNVERSHLVLHVLQVPFEHLKKAMRTSTRLVEKEVNAVVAGVADAIDKDMSKEEAVQRLTSLVSRLQGLKRKVG